jgi:hypothetical protein
VKIQIKVARYKSIVALVICCLSTMLPSHAESWISKKWHMILNKNPPSPPPPPPSQPPIISVADCSLSSDTIHLGQSFTLKISINQPAPAGGISIGIDRNSDGAMDTLHVTPTSMTIPAGSNNGSVELQTQSVPGAAKTIIFTAYTSGGARKSVQLNILH